jgi:hypothetical protein
VDNIWLGLERDNNSYKCTDGSEMDFSNWSKGSPNNKTDNNCVQMLSESDPVGQWANEPCNKKSVIVCQKTPTVTISFLHKKLLETNKKLIETQQILNEYLNNKSSNKWINYELFTDTDGKRKAFFIPYNEKGNFEVYHWGDASKSCEKFNATLVEVQALQKQNILETYVSQLGLESNRVDWFWLNAQRESNGNWKWITSGKEFTYTNWMADNPKADSGIYYTIFPSQSSNFGKWYITSSDGNAYPLCEIELAF